MRYKYPSVPLVSKYHEINGKRCDCRKALTREEQAKIQQAVADREARSYRSRGYDESSHFGWYF